MEERPDAMMEQKSMPEKKIRNILYMLRKGVHKFVDVEKGGAPMKRMHMEYAEICQYLKEEKKGMSN